MRFYAISVDQIVYRFYFMMATVLFALFSGWTFLALLALPIFLSAVLGIRFRPQTPLRTAAASRASDEGKVVVLPASGAPEAHKVA